MAEIEKIQPFGTEQYNFKDIKAIRTYTRAEVGSAPNYDNPGFNGLFEIRGSSEVPDETGTRPYAGWYPCLTAKVEHVMLQIAGGGTSYYIRGKQGAGVTMADTTWNRIVLNSGTWDISISGNAATATALTSSAGSSTVPIYFSGGKPVQCSTTLGVSITGNAATATKLSNTPSNTTTFLRGDNTWSNTLTGPLYVNNASDAEASAQGSGALIIGNKAGQNIAIDDNEIMCHNNTSTATLYLNNNGGTVSVGSGGISTSGVIYTPDLRAANTRLVSNWLGFYQNTNAGGSRYGYIQCNADRMYFRKENSSSQSYYFDFGNRIYAPSASFGYNNTSYTLSASSAIINSWIRTTGSTGWYNETYGGGWYMTDSTYIRNYNSKIVLCNNEIISTNANAFRLVYGNYGLILRNDGDSFWMLATASGSPYSGWRNYSTGHPFRIQFSTGYVYTGRCYGAVWNDYAEFRKDNIKEKEQQIPGKCIKENGDGTLSLTTKRLEKGCEIISDTFGFSIGQDINNGYDTPVASSGRVLAYTYEPIEKYKKHIGDCVCSGPNGTISIMTEEEEMKYPGRIIGTISEIPTYEEWGPQKIKVNGRVWIRVR